MNLFETNSALGHNQKAILLEIQDNVFLVVNTINCNNNSPYVIGELVSHIEPSSLNKIDEDIIKQSPIVGNFLFDYFLKKEFNFDFHSITSKSVNSNNISFHSVPKEY